MKKLFIFIISLFVCIGVFQTRVKADGETFIDGDGLLDAPTETTTPSDEISYNNGSIPKPYIVNSKYYGFEELGKKIPESYLTSNETTNKGIKDLDAVLNISIDYPEDKPRSKFAISWAEAVCQAAERTYDRLHRTEKTEIDLSEMHLAWFAYNNDGTTTTKNGTDVFNIGGSPAMATLALANGIGFVEDEKFPIKDSYTNEEFAEKTNTNKTYKPDYILTMSEWFPLKTDLDRERVKKVLDNGTPLAVSFHVTDEYLKDHKTIPNADLSGLGEDSLKKSRINYKDSIYMSEELAADLGETTEPNYNGLLVGWIDNYTEDNWFNWDLINTFNNTDTLVPNKDYKFNSVYHKEVNWKTGTPSSPTNPGAWIIKVNTDDKTEKFYYLSYEDASISNSVAVYYQVQKSTNDSIVTHQLDNNTGFNYYEVDGNEAIFYNVYTPQKKEYIDSVGLFTYQNNVDYEVFVFAGDLEKDTTLEDIFNRNTVCIHGEGTIANAGYHKINLRGNTDSFYNSLNYAGCQDQKIYVIVKYTTAEGTNVLIPTDGVAKNFGDFSSKSTATANSTSILVDNNSNIDLVTVAGSPAKIKLLTYAVDNKIIYHLGEGVTIPEGTKDFYRDYNDLNDVPTPTKEGYEFYAWYTDSELSPESRLRERPDTEESNIDLYPAFKQRVVFEYDNKTVVSHVNDYESKTAIVPNIEVPSTADGEFAGWEYTDSKGTKHTINLYNGSYIFGDAKLNGEDIILTPLFEKVKPEEEHNVNDIINNLSEQDKDKKVIYVSPTNPQIISIAAEDLEDAVDESKVKENNSNKAILWVEAKEITKTEDNTDETSKQYDGFKEKFEKIVEDVTYKVCKLIDINVFSQEEGKDEGTKVAELTKKVSIEYDLSGDENAELREAAENGKLQISQMHNGEILDIDSEDIEYDKETMKLKFQVQKFSIFAFSVGTPTPADTPTGESGDTPTGGDTSGGSDTNKSTENKSTNTTTPDPDFKTPNTGIY